MSPMLFILVMDVLSLMVSMAATSGLLQPLSSRALQHRISLYVDDVVLFLRSEANDISITMDILSLFGEASGLKTNVQKSNVFPIRCQEEDCRRSDSPASKFVYYVSRLRMVCSKDTRGYTGSGRMSLRPVHGCSCYWHQVCSRGYKLSREGEASQVSLGSSGVCLSLMD